MEATGNLLENYPAGFVDTLKDVGVTSGGVRGVARGRPGDRCPRGRQIQVGGRPG